MAQAEALRRENELLRAENHRLRTQVAASEIDRDMGDRRLRMEAEACLWSEDHWVRGTLIALALLLMATLAGSVILRGKTFIPPSRSLPFEPSEQVFSEALRHVFTNAPEVPQYHAPAPADATTPSPPTHAVNAFAPALTPLLQECFSGSRGRVDLVATVDARGRARHVYVLHEGGALASPAERRCVRRALAALALPTTRGDFTAYGPCTELHLVLLPARAGRHTRRG